ncbi:MAG: hypothetical protein IJV24_06730 [Prevotella sp.]|nr:hypothetical protein [Prevotella sp.]
MKIDNQTIIDAARRQREQDETTIGVPRWRTARRHPFAVPAWLVALPAAAIVGFLFGLFVRQPLSTDQPLTALVDTIYVTREIPANVAEAPSRLTQRGEEQDSPKVEKSIKPARKASPVRGDHVEEAPPTGRNVSEDGINYSMLVLK